MKSWRRKLVSADGEYIQRQIEGEHDKPKGRGGAGEESSAVVSVQKDCPLSRKKVKPLSP